MQRDHPHHFSRRVLSQLPSVLLACAYSKPKPGRIDDAAHQTGQCRRPDETRNEKGPNPFEPGPSSHVVVKLFLDLRLPRPCR